MSIQNVQVRTVRDLVRLLRTYPPELEVHLLDDGRHIRSVEWAQGGFSTWLVLSDKESVEE